mgnify:CR=1 FL=1
MNLIKVLYNDACGDWSFSDEFFSEEFIHIFKNRYNINLEGYTNSYRYDPRVIELFEELGSKKSSHEYASLKTTMYPEEWIDCMYIQVFEGREHIVFSRDKAYKKLLEEMISARSVTDKNIEMYNSINDVYNKYRL